MKYYTETIPLPLAKKLKEKGMPMEEGGKSIIDWKIPTYSEIFDWFFKKGIEVEVYLSMTRLDAAKNPVQKIYAWNVYSRHSEANGEEDEMSWHEAANAAIEKALTLVYESMENIFYAISNPLWLSDTFICSKIKGYDKYCFVKVNVFNRIEEIGVDVEKRLHGAKIEEMTKYYVPVTKTHKMRFNSIAGEMWWELIHKSRYYDKSH